MKAGDTFLKKDDRDQHLWIVLSEPQKDPASVLLVNMTSLKEKKEKTCVLHPGNHPWIRHDTCINYSDAIVTSLDRLLDAKLNGAIVLQEPLTGPILRRIQTSAANSTRLEIEKFEILLAQGLCDC